jgi:hypothetical protein
VSVFVTNATTNNKHTLELNARRAAQAEPTSEANQISKARWIFTNVGQLQVWGWDSHFKS